MLLKVVSPKAWLDAVLAEFDLFLLDHAANERKASAMAMSMVAHYPDRERLVAEMIDLALEELNHFRQVVRLARQRGLQMCADTKDPYVNQLRGHIRKGKDEYFMDRLLSAAVIEGRGAERFALIGEGVSDAELASFYTTLARSERNHHTLFIDLAYHYFPPEHVDGRLDEWLEIEAGIVKRLEIRPVLH